MHPAVEFEFWPGDKVTNPHGEPGIVETCAVELGGYQRFWVTFPGDKNGQWYNRNELTSVEAD